MSDLFTLTNSAINLSNVVLTLLFPKITEFADRVGLPERTASIADVRRFRPDLDELGGWFTFSNGNMYWFSHGHVNGFRSRGSYYELQDPSLIPRFYGPLNMSKTQVIELAQATIRKLGYTEEMVFADLEPEVIMPPRIGTNIVPHFLIEWPHPNRPGMSVRMEINGSNRRVEKLGFLNFNLWRSPPRVPGVPEATANQPVQSPGPNDSKLLLNALRQIRRFAECLNLPITPPLRSSDVEKAVFPAKAGTGVTEITLTNSFSFTLDGPEVMAFRAPDTFFAPGGAKEVRVKDFVGSWKITEAEAITVARKAVLKLGYPSSLVSEKPDIQKPYGGARDLVPRCRIDWFPTDPGVKGSWVIAEVDGASGALKWLFIVFTAPESITR